MPTVSKGLTTATISFPSRTATGTRRCLRANGREIFDSTMATSSFSVSILKKCSRASSAMSRARRKSSMRVPVPLASVRFMAMTALNGLASSSAPGPFPARAAAVRHCRSTASTSARCRSSMKPALNRSSPRYATVISRVLRGAGGAVTVMTNAECRMQNAKFKADPLLHCAFCILHSIGHFQQKPLQILAFRAEERHRMILPRGQPLDERNAPAGVVRGREDDFLEEVERHVAGAGEVHHQPAGLDELEREEVDVLVAARGALDLAARLRERGRIADDEAEALFRLADVGENVGDGEADVIFERVQIVVFPRRFDGRRGDVDVLHERRAARRRVDAERAAVREEVEHAPSARVRAGEGAVVALIEEEAGLLSGGNVDVKAKAVLEDRTRRIAVADRLRFHRKMLELPRRDVVLEVDQPRRQLLLQRGDDERLQALQPLVRDLDHHHIVIAIDDEAAQLVALGVHDARGVRGVVEK